jgi:hypothetical protein
MNKFILAAVLLLTSSVAMAGSVYLGISAGNSQVQLTEGSDVNGTAFKSILGYQFTPRLGAEISYSDMGKDTLLSTSTDNIGTTEYFRKNSVTIFTADLTYTLAVDEHLSVIGKAGLADVTIDGSSFNILIVEDEEDVYSGQTGLYTIEYTALHAYLGLLYAFDDTFAVNMGVDYTEGSEYEHVLATYLGFTVTF